MNGIIKSYKGGKGAHKQGARYCDPLDQASRHLPLTNNSMWSKFSASQVDVASLRSFLVIDSSFTDTHDCCRTNVQSSLSPQPSRIRDRKAVLPDGVPCVLSTCGRRHASGAFKITLHRLCRSVLDSSLITRCTASSFGDHRHDEIEKKC